MASQLTIHMKVSEITTDQVQSTSPPEELKLAPLSCTVDRVHKSAAVQDEGELLLVLQVVHVLYMLLLWYKYY